MKKRKPGRKTIPHSEVIASLQAFFKKVNKRFTIAEFDNWTKKRCRARVVMSKFKKGWHACLKKAGIV